MKENGVSSAVVIVIFIVIVTVGVGSYFILKDGKGRPGGLPVYSGSESYDIPEEYLGELGLPGGVEIEGYAVSDVSVQDILDWYSDHMTEWTIEEEWTQSFMGMIIGTQLYRKGTEGTGVIAMSGTGIVGGAIYILATGPWSEFEEAGPSTPPSAMLTVTAEAQGSNVGLTISHEGGDDMDVDDLEIMASISDGTMTTLDFPGTGTFSVGDDSTATYAYGPNPQGKVITVYIIHVPSKQKIFSSATVVVK